jgi:hypothetical protein
MNKLIRNEKNARKEEYCFTIREGSEMDKHDREMLVLSAIIVAKGGVAAAATGSKTGPQISPQVCDQAP